MHERSSGTGQEGGQYGKKYEDLVRYCSQDEWEINEGDTNIVGWNLVDNENNKIGKVDDLLIDTDASDVVFVVVKYGGTLGMGGDTTAVPMDLIRLDRDKERVILPESKDRLNNSPRYSDDTRDFRQFHDYWSAQRAGMGTSARYEEEQPEMIKGGERAIPEAEEHLETGKQAEQVGEVRARKEVETHPETVRETLAKTRVRIFKRGAEAGQTGQTIGQGETVGVPIVEEKLVVEKKPEVTGEVVIQPETVQEEAERTEQVRKEHVVVEREGQGELDEEEEETEEEQKPKHHTFGY